MLDVPAGVIEKLITNHILLCIELVRKNGTQYVQ